MKDTIVEWMGKQRKRIRKPGNGQRQRNKKSGTGDWIV